MRTLVVDDSRVIRSILRRYLSELGWEVFEAGHGVEALQVLEREGPMDVALVDWNMPEMDGITFLRTVRRIPRFRSMVVLMVTTETEADRVVQAMAAGASEYLMKPFDKEALLARLTLLGLVGPA